jgi:hypothetical protein
MNRAQKALAENIILAIRTRTAKWTYHEKKSYNTSVSRAIDIAKRSFNLEKLQMTDNHYVIVVLAQIKDCVRIARCYYDMTAEEIIKSLNVVLEVLVES